MSTFIDAPLRLLHKLADKKHSGGCAITTDVVLCHRSPRDHDCCRVLDLHFLQEGVPILGQLDVTSSTDKHLDGALGAEVSLEHVLEALGGVNVHVQRRRVVEHLRVGVQRAERHGCGARITSPARSCSGSPGGISPETAAERWGARKREVREAEREQ
uniref:Uncharacterized protein n=1 Tax=Arundo donax TaxID=35708 RepID=A0A0A9DDV5_ARUDO